MKTIVKFYGPLKKYINIQQNLKFEYPYYETEQITLVMWMRGSGHDFVDNKSKVVANKCIVSTIRKNMLKSIVSSGTNLLRMFKIQSMISNS